MTQCPSCGDQVAGGKRFCGSCGSQVSTTASVSSGRKAVPAKRKGVLMIVAFLNVIGVGAFFALSSGGSSTEQGFFEELLDWNLVEGTVTSSGAPLGEKSWTPPVCSSGQHEGFHGVYLGVVEDKSPHIKIIKDPDKGYKVKLHGCEPKCRTVTLSKKRCDTFDVKVERTNTTINDVVAIDGHLRLDCQLKKKKGDAVKVTSRINFEGCY